MSVEIRGAQVVDALRGKQVRLLLAYLILNRARSVGREELINALWPFTAPQSQDAALRTLLSRLRSAVSGSVLTGRERLSLVLPEPVWIDVEAAHAEIGRALSALEQGDVRNAWALSQVPFNIANRGLLPGIQAAWLEPPRRELDELRLQALEVIGRAGLGLGGSQVVSAERAARALIAAEPYRESAYLLLMDALAAQGNIAEGLRIFDQLRMLLRRELGTMPSPEALAVHERLLNPAPRSAPLRLDLLGSEARIGLPAELAARGRGPLVGRGREMGELERVWELARSGHISGPATPDGGARVLVLAGDPGVGKTRLTAEIARRVHDHGGVVLAGRAPEESLVPYQPFLEALRHYVVGAPLDELRTTAREYGSELARLVPELRRRAPDLVSAAPVEPETERYRMFEAVVGLLSAISHSAPILIVLDDLQWADRPTLLLLRHLARAGDPRRLLVLAAYRAIETPPHGFRAVLADLHREQLLQEVQIGGLNEPDTTELVRVRTGRAPATAFAHALHEQTEGNPLFIEEIVRHLTDAGVDVSSADAAVLQRFGLPEGVKQVIARRLDELGTPAVEWLRVAAVIGRDFDAGLLERVLDVSEQEFLDLLDDGLASGLVVERGGEPGLYSFSHALIRETLYEGMSAPRRARLHRRVGQALETASGEPELNALALHFARANNEHDAGKAIDYAVAAGQRATAMLAHEDAVEHYARALEVQERFHPGDEARRCELLLLRGEAQVQSGGPNQAWPVLREAARLAERLEDGAALARAAVAASRRHLQQPGVVDENEIALLERALEFTEGERTSTRVLLLSRLCGALYFSPQRDRMTKLSREAEEIAERLDVPEARVFACAARRRALWDPAHLDDRLVASTQMLRLASQTGNIEHQLQAHAWLVVDLLEQGERAAADAQIEAFTAGAERLRQPVFVWHATVWRAMRAMLSGQLELAETHASEALGIGSPAETVAAPQYYAAQMLGIRREQDRSGELEVAARAFVEANPHRPAWKAALADLLMRSAQGDEARALFDELAVAGFDTIAPDGDWMTAVTILAEIAHGLKDAERAAVLYELLIPYERQNVVIGLGAMCLGASGRYLGRLAATMGDAERATSHFEQALHGNARLGAVVEFAHTQLDLARLLGVGSRARRLIEAAARTAEQLELPRLTRRSLDLSRD